MSNFQNNSYPQAGGNGQYAVMTPPPRQEKKVMPLAYTAGGGLLVGVMAGLLLISGGSATKAVAANAPMEENSPPAAEEPEGRTGQTPEEGGAAEPAGQGIEPAADEPENDEPATDVPVEEPVPEPELLQAAVTFDVTPSDVLADLKIEVDGESVSDQSLVVPLDPTSGFTTVRVVAVASGYRDFEQSVKVKGDMNVPVKMRKVPEPTALKSSGDNNRRRKGSRDGKSSNDKSTGNKSGGPGGLLDL